MFNVVWLYASIGRRLPVRRRRSADGERDHPDVPPGPWIYLAATLVVLVNVDAGVILFLVLALFYVLESSVFGSRGSGLAPIGVKRRRRPPVSSARAAGGSVNAYLSSACGLQQVAREAIEDARRLPAPRQQPPVILRDPGIAVDRHDRERLASEHAANVLRRDLGAPRPIHDEIAAPLEARGPA